MPLVWGFVMPLVWGITPSCGAAIRSELLLSFCKSTLLPARARTIATDEGYLRVRMS
ncbi:hypothetical protein MASSI9I_51387 [Massilia sp. 9I]|nr:hypothetical protein MASSI9I_51387 [Massilia sp. 9I]